MRRILLLATVAVMMAAMMALTAGPASATIHSLSCADRNVDEDTDTSHAAPDSAGATQEPAGITDDDGQVGQGAEERQPILSVNQDAPEQSQANENARGKKAPPEGDCQD